MAMTDDDATKPEAPGAGTPDTTAGSDAAGSDGPTRLQQLRREIDELDRQIVALMNERARTGRAIGREKQALGWATARDPEREREVLLRVSMANEGPIAQEDLLAIYRRVIDATRSVEDRDRARETRERG